MKRAQKKPDHALNGISIASLTLNQEGDLEVEFDLPAEQTTSSWYSYMRGSRTFDIYEDEELQEVCRRLFQLVRKRVEKPDSERLEIHCDSCATSSCCRKYNVLLREEDIERLAKGLEMTAPNLRKKYTTPAVDWCGDYERQLAADEDDEGREKCVFLKETDGLWRCSVYEHRPKICRDFDMRSCDDFIPIEDVGQIED